jgi:hypothetical protein
LEKSLGTKKSFKAKVRGLDNGNAN